MKILVVGNSDRARNDFVRDLAMYIQIPFFYQFLYRENRDGTIVSNEEFENRIKEEMKRNHWIMDGSFFPILDYQMDEADVIIYIDFPIEGKTLFDLNEDELIEPFKKLKKEVEDNSRFVINSFLNRHSDKEIYIFKNKDETQKFLNDLYLRKIDLGSKS